MHPESPQNLTKFMLEKTLISGVDVGSILTFKMIPKMIPKSAKMAPLGSQVALWGRHGAHQVPQDRLWAPIWHPK